MGRLPTPWTRRTIGAVLHTVKERLNQQSTLHWLPSFLPKNKEPHSTDVRKVFQGAKKQSPKECSYASSMETDQPQFPMANHPVQTASCEGDWSLNCQHLLAGLAPVLKELVCLWGFLFFNHCIFLFVVRFDCLEQQFVPKVHDFLINL